MMNILARCSPPIDAPVWPFAMVPRSIGGRCSVLAGFRVLRLDALDSGHSPWVQTQYYLFFRVASLPRLFQDGLCYRGSWSPVPITQLFMRLSQLATA